jgi:hypothetical protein
MLDVAFGEDGTRLRKDHGPENMATFRKLALTAARADTETKSSSIGRRWLGRTNIWKNSFFNPNLPQNRANLYVLALQRVVCPPSSTASPGFTKIQFNGAPDPAR